MDRVRASFARQTFMDTLGVEIETIEPGFVVLGMAFNARMGQQHGFHHAGVAASVMDSACGYAAYSLMSAEASVVTVEFKINLLAPAQGTRFRYEGEVIRPGRTLTACEGRAYATGPAGEVLIATMSSTMMAIPDAQEVGRGAGS